MFVEESIRQYVTQNLLFLDGPYPYPDETSFLASGVMDSFGVVELATFIEQTFGFKVAMADVVPDHFDSVQKLAAYVRRQSPLLAALEPEALAVSNAAGAIPEPAVS